MPFLDQLTNFQNQFNSLLRQFLYGYKQRLPFSEPVTDDLLDAIIDFTLRGGKRLRPALLYYTYACFTDANPAHALQLGLACEMMESSLLIHDDIMDGAATRRGGPTIHQLFTQPTPKHGESLALLAGYTCSFLGVQAIQKMAFAPELSQKLISNYSQIALDECLGQALDLQLTVDQEIPTEHQIFTTYRYKTARYTTEFPLISGLILAEAEQAYYPAFAKIGINLGLAFQIQDDIIGLFGDPEKTGKSSTSDLEEGKKTILISHAYEHAGATDQQTIIDTLKADKISTQDVSKIKQIIQDQGSVEYATNYAKKLIAEAKAELDTLCLRAEGKYFLLSLFDYLVNREI